MFLRARVFNDIALAAFAYFGLLSTSISVSLKAALPACAGLSCRLMPCMQKLPTQLCPAAPKVHVQPCSDTGRSDAACKYSTVALQMMPSL